MKLSRFRTVPLSIIRSYSMYTQQWYMSYRFADSLRVESRWSILILLENCQQTCMTHIIAVCTLKNSWWWTEELSETCRVSFQESIWEIMHLLGFNVHICPRIFDGLRLCLLWRERDFTVHIASNPVHEYCLFPLQYILVGGSARV